MSSIRIISALLILSLAVTGALGQTAGPVRLCVSLIPTGTEPTELQQHAWTAAKQRLDSLGVTTTSKQEEYVLFINATEERGQVAVSLLFGHLLPDEVVDLTKKAEVFYTGIRREKRATLPEDGKWVRELVTEDFMRQFVMPMESRLLLAQTKDLQATLQHGVDALYEKYLKPGKP
jgi:hypothetical protein